MVQGQAVPRCRSFQGGTNMLRHTPAAAPLPHLDFHWVECNRGGHGARPLCLACHPLFAVPCATYSRLSFARQSPVSVININNIRLAGAVPSSGAAHPPFCSVHQCATGIKHAIRHAKSAPGYIGRLHPLLGVAVCRWEVQMLAMCVICWRGQCIITSAAVWHSRPPLTGTSRPSTHHRNNVVPKPPQLCSPLQFLASPGRPARLGRYRLHWRTAATSAPAQQVERMGNRLSVRNGGSGWTGLQSQSIHRDHRPCNPKVSAAWTSLTTALSQLVVAGWADATHHLKGSWMRVSTCFRFNSPWAEPIGAQDAAPLQAGELSNQNSTKTG